MAAHQIVVLDEDDLRVYWQCRCGEDADGYGSVAEARLAAAEHQLGADVQAEIGAVGLIPGHIEEWRNVVQMEADHAAEADPAAWAWYRATRPAPSA